MSSVCYLTLMIDSRKLKRREKIQILQPVSIDYEIEKRSFHPIIEHIISRTCDMKIYGYNKKEEVFWCKETKNCICTLFINISLCSIDYTHTKVIITPVVCNATDFECFITKFKDAMKLYEKSKVIRDYLEN